MHGSTARRDNVVAPEEALPTGYVETDFSQRYLYKESKLSSQIGKGGFATVTR